MTDLLVVIAALLTTILSSARITRLVVHDSFPPTMWLRMKWDDLTDESDWNKLLHCGFCFSYWATVVVGGWLYLTWRFGGETAWTVWFAVNGSLALSYLAAMIVERDERGA